jgi:hypothetical protein
MKKFALTVTLLGLWATGAVHAGEFFCDAGNVTCLIDAINKANLNNDENTINLAAGTYTLTSVDNSSTPFGNNDLPQITSPILINGESAETTIIERDSDAPAFGIFAVGDSGTLTLNGLTVRGSLSNFGGILNTGTLTVNDSIIAENRDLGSGFGGGISNRGTMTMAHSIVTNNSAVLAGGGIFNSGITNIVSSSITDNTSEGGGAVNNFTAGATMIVQNSTISNNNADGGGGIANSGTMTVTSTTISDNLAGFFDGGGIANGGTLTITNSTISRNIAGFFASRSPGGGIANNDWIVKLQNTIMASNFADSGNDCFGPITSLGNNIIGDPNNCDINLLASDITGDPGLGDFVDDGMPGRAHFPLNLGSQAIDAGNPEACLQADQLGLLRIGICDIGAVEFRARCWFPSMSGHAAMLIA